MLSPNLKRDVRNEIADFCSLAESYEARWAYDKARPYSGLGAAPQTFHRDDCSSYVALVFYWAAKHAKVFLHDPLNEGYNGWGNTETALAYLEAHKAPKEKLRIGDIAIYGWRGNLASQHMVVCRRSGTSKTAVFSSHGEQSGPEPRVGLAYPGGHKPTIGVYRHPALA